MPWTRFRWFCLTPVSPARTRCLFLFSGAPPIHLRQRIGRKAHLATPGQLKPGSGGILFPQW
ncbi:hypothetical protein RADP37_03995 [Roseomonas mucosa]|uniref:Uncharacterized protein n=1 Tax=Roseomonas mucosa TaxID=207340 RepID=A0A4Y1MT88_9PROT|nr:hypothetical protein RADP37_03995 [Roseomonas mucosa]